MPMMKSLRQAMPLWLGTLGLALAACGGAGSSSPEATSSAAGTADPGVRRDPASIRTDALIYNGQGTASVDTASLQSILTSHGLTYHTVDETQMNALTLDELASYGVILWPGGYAATMDSYLTEATRARIRSAVRDRAVSYLGFCAGTFITGTYAGSSPWGIKLTSVEFPYYHLEDEGVEAAMVDVSFPDGSTRNLLWYGGPRTEGFGSTIARYPDGTGAISQGWVGKGFVILSGPHPEGPQSWRTAFGLTDSDGLDFEYAAQLISSAIHQKPMPAF